MDPLLKPKTELGTGNDDGLSVPTRLATKSTTSELTKAVEDPVLDVVPVHTASGEESESQPTEGWRANLITNKNGEPLGNLANCMTALRSPDWQGVLGFDQNLQRAVAIKAPPFSRAIKTPLRWDDDADTQTAVWMQKERIPASASTAGRAVQSVARENSFHPIQDYLNGLEWDGIPRLDMWLEYYVGAHQAPPEYLKAVGSRFLISAVARVFKPGSQADAILILEGRQGCFKSTSVSVLAGQWYSDDIGSFGTKDAAMQLWGYWIVELSELDALTGVGVSKTKSFATRREDKFRPPYGRHTIVCPRGSVFIGTTNKQVYLKDETDNRRFWPVRCGDQIKVDELRRDRDQIWAEAVMRFRAGEQWHLTPELEVLAAAEQRARLKQDDWLEPIRQFTAKTQSVSLGEIRARLGITEAQWTQAAQNRAVRCLQTDGWERYRDRKRNQEWRYRRQK